MIEAFASIHRASCSMACSSVSGCDPANACQLLQHKTLCCGQSLPSHNMTEFNTKDKATLVLALYIIQVYFQQLLYIQLFALLCIILLGYVHYKEL